MSFPAYTNKKVCSIDALERHDLAIRFVKEISQRLCVYSSTLQHVYGEYSIETVTSSTAKLVIVPKNHSLERFINVCEEAVIPTGVHVYPGWYFKLKAPCVMTLPIKTKQGEKRSRPISPGHGFQIMERNFYQEEFLPLLKNGDLRELDQETPHLHLHRLAPKFATSLSQFDLSQLCKLIQEKRSRLVVNGD